MTSRKSSGSMRADSAVEPTRSENITVTWRRSAVGSTATEIDGGIAAVKIGAGLTSGVADGAASALPNAAIARNIFRRCPSETPSSLRS